ncbi:MBL fold metallo-hydrolase [Brevibacillus ginsengisoli]|uniref:MBL fold metallo-hydrolase n=1 Tax=Brevibacillus ginsengisoli TaxID=363854 RepID=UPI003CEF5B43
MFTPKKRYANLDDVSVTKTFAEVRKWRKERKAKPKDLSYTVPSEDGIDYAWIRNNREQTSVIWIGHATFFIQVNGLNILIDPVWASRMGFEKRLSPPGLPLEELPAIDVVLISHGHYDHLNFSTLRKLPGSPTYLVPAGLARLFSRKGLTKVQEYNWWEQEERSEVTFTFVPAQHWVRRTLWDTNTSHWGGWVIEHQGKTIYYAGDSGYFRGFREIGERFAIDIALLPIGAYEPEWFMSSQHMTPEEAIRLFGELRAKLFIPMHYGAFRLADDTPKEALDRLTAEWDRQRLADEQLRILRLGEVMKL